MPSISRTTTGPKAMGPVWEAEPIDQALLRQEVAELSSFRDLALSIRENAKGTALLTALATGFAQAERLGAPRKAIIFTESRPDAGVPRQPARGDRVWSRDRPLQRLQRRQGLPRDLRGLADDPHRDRPYHRLPHGRHADPPWSTTSGTRVRS